MKNLYRNLISLLGTIKYYVLIDLRYRWLAHYGTEPGINEVKRDIPLIISLTSIPDRFSKIHLCLESLLRQSIKPDYIYLWLSETETKIPNSLEKLKKRGITISFCKDIKSYTKIIYCLEQNPNALIVTADDDIIYPPNWLEELYLAYQKQPEYVHCHRAHLINKNTDGSIRGYKEWDFNIQDYPEASNLIFPTGVGGVLYAPGMLNNEVFNKELFIQICPTADDVWLKAMSLLNGYQCKKTNANINLIEIKGTQTNALWKQNTTDGANKNDIQIKAVFNHYKLYQNL
ncbi:MAG: hypothetical protein CTY34_06070 [Methylobacter sp.]|nr:MAG: hypothetical protein CTY34_06070 [Methylobacter sp.]PPD05224.1 MAG: hypothetical protein CTY29_02030 [Methylobacter sp.]